MPQAYQSLNPQIQPGQVQPPPKPPAQLPSGWTPMPSIASQIETDPVKKQQHAFNNLIRANTNLQPQQPQAQPQQQGMPGVGAMTAPQMPGVGKQAEAVKLDVPHNVQKTDYTCGPAALKSVLEHYGEETTEKALEDQTEANPDKGTNAKQLIAAAKAKGLHTEEKSGMSIKDLKDYLDQKKPVIICIQAWDEDDNKEASSYEDDWDHGHYVVAIGYDDKNIYFEDPAIEKEAVGYLPTEELEKRWHYGDPGSGEKHYGYGVALWKDKKTEKTASQRARAALSLVKM